MNTRTQPINSTKISTSEACIVPIMFLFLAFTLSTQSVAGEETSSAFDSTAATGHQFTFEGKYGYIDKRGKWAIDPKFDFACDFCQGLAAVQINGKFGFITKSGTYKIEPQFENAKSFSQGLAAVALNGKFGFIDRFGRFVIKAQFDNAVPFSEGLAAVKLDGKWGFIDRHGEFQIPPRYTNRTEIIGDAAGSCFVSQFRQGVAAVEEGDNWGYIDKNGNWLITPQFKTASPFTNGFAAVQDSAWRYIFIDKKGTNRFPGSSPTS